MATDLNPRQLQSAQEHLATRYPWGIPPDLELRAADVLHLPFADASSNVVFAFVAIHHASPSHRDFADVPRALAEISLVLQPGGTLAYMEIVHKERIRAWLQEYDYRLHATLRSWAHETVVTVKEV